MIEMVDSFNHWSFGHLRPFVKRVLSFGKGVVIKGHCKFWIFQSFNGVVAVVSLLSFLLAMAYVYVILFPRFQPVIDKTYETPHFNSSVSECNYFEGNWIQDESYPLYDASQCPFAENGFNCLANGRRDRGYTKWRWKPKNCEIPRFNAREILEKMRGKRIVFVGDSLSRTQWESLICMLMTGVEDKRSVYEINGNKITKQIRFLGVRFSSFDLRIDFYRSVFLVQPGPAPRRAPKRVKSTLKIDQLDDIRNEWIDSDILIFNSGHWWTPSKLFEMGCYFLVGRSLKIGMPITAAFERALHTWASWLNTTINCGVGVEVSEEDIEQTVNEVFKQNKGSILELRYRINVGDLFGHVRKRLPWADPKIVKKLIDAKLYELLGERTAADNEKPSKQKKEKPAKVEDKKVADENPVQPSEDLNPFLIFPNPEDNFKVHTEVFFSDRPVLRCCNTKEVLDKHLKRTSGKVYTRFPPEPNGYLHIGHAKAMFVSFGLAKERGGCCYLRYDDTNPEAEKKEYIDHIEEIVEWMGWKPFKITYTSDYFQELYELAVELIRRGHAYVDHQTPEEIKEYREKKMDSPWRDRPIAESLELFEEMRRGMIEEGKATLRMKQDMQSDNGNMYDLIAYRIKFTPHPHSGDKWCIYPSYDYAHCIVDSLEDITHSLCTLEFETRRASYYWLLHVLDLYQPYVWEYSRLNVTNTVMSKRKLNFLVTNKHVDGWDDPRLMTLAGLKRRGVTSTAINAFVRGIGITRSDCSTIRLERLEYHIREELNRTAPRTMVVLQPLKVVVTNLESGLVMDLDAKKWPDASTEDSSAFYKVPFSRVVYIEQSDFRMKDSKDYYGLAPGKSVLLRYAFPIKCTEVVLADDNKSIVEIRAEYDPSKKTKPKGVIHWVAEPSREVDPLSIEVRLFDKLFNSENPAEHENWLSDVNPQSKVVMSGAYAVPSLRDAAMGDRFQFERLGYFVVDKDSTPERLVFNRTVTLRDSYGKSGK